MRGSTGRCAFKKRIEGIVVVLFVFKTFHLFLIVVHYSDEVVCTCVKQDSQPIDHGGARSFMESFLPVRNI